MTFVVDEQLPPELADWLVGRGHEAVHVRDLGLGSADDRRIREAARASGAVVITKDGDFVQIRRAADRVLWLRCGNLRRAHFIPKFAEAWPDALRALESGEFLVETSLQP